MMGDDTPLDADFWDDLLTCIEERRVIPVIGAELCTVVRDGHEVPLYRVVAEALAERLRISAASLPVDFTLHHVVCSHLERRGRREDVYPKVRAILKDLAPVPSQPLLDLAAVGHFDLYVTLTCDSLMSAALDQVRYAGAPTTPHLAYAPHRVQDLPQERERLPGATVFALLGRASAAPDFVITEEDVLEFFSALQTESRRPHLLFDALANNHLLLIGCGFPDWLARFFIRIAKSRQLSMQRGETEILVDPHAGRDRDLVLFLEHFSYATRVIQHASRDFVHELAGRWQARNPGGAAAHVGATPGVGGAARDALPAAGDTLPEMPPGAIFISYAKEDFAAVSRLAASLEALGLDLWLDRERLEAGDQYDLKIRRNIRSCSLFLPIISRNTERRVEGYFRREWRLAEERSLSIADNVPFLLPVVVDDTPPYNESVPERMRAAQWSMLPEGRTTPDFEARMVKLVREFRLRERGMA